MGFGDRIRELRLEKNWNQEYVAEKLSISVAALSRYESSMYEPKSLKLLCDFASLYNVTTDYLVGKVTNKNPKTLELSDNDIQFIKNIKKLDDTNKMIIENTMEALLEKQEKNEKKEN